MKNSYKYGHVGMYFMVRNTESRLCIKSGVFDTIIWSCPFSIFAQNTIKSDQSTPKIWILTNQIAQYPAIENYK
jgi:hypothetical protein